MFTGLAESTTAKKRTEAAQEMQVLQGATHAQTWRGRLSEGVGGLTLTDPLPSPGLALPCENRPGPRKGKKPWAAPGGVSITTHNGPRPLAPLLCRADISPQISLKVEVSDVQTERRHKAVRGAAVAGGKDRALDSWRKGVLC